MERQDALLWWYAQWVVKTFTPAAERICDVVGVRLPQKKQRGGGALVVAQRVGKALANPERLARMAVLCRDVEAPVVELVRRSPNAVFGPGASLDHVETWPGVEWILVDAGMEGFFAKALSEVPEALQQRYAEFVDRIIRAATETEEAWRRRREADVKAAAEVGQGVAALRAAVERAREQAALERRKAQHAAKEGAGRVAAAERARAAAERARADAEQRAANLDSLLAERDAQLGEVVADYERRLAAMRAALDGRGAPEERAMVERVAPLSGRRVLVIGDAPRAPSYRASAKALGAEDVVFAEGMDRAAGPQISGQVSAADVVVLVTAHVHHGTCELVRRRARRGTAVVMVPVAGMRAFREALAVQAPAVL